MKKFGFGLIGVTTIMLTSCYDNDGIFLEASIAAKSDILKHITMDNLEVVYDQDGERDAWYNGFELPSEYSYSNETTDLTLNIEYSILSYSEENTEQNFMTIEENKLYYLRLSENAISADNLEEVVEDIYIQMYMYIDRSSIIFELPYSKILEAEHVKPDVKYEGALVEEMRDIPVGLKQSDFESSYVNYNSTNQSYKEMYRIFTPYTSNTRYGVEMKYFALYWGYSSSDLVKYEAVNSNLLVSNINDGGITLEDCTEYSLFYDHGNTTGPLLSSGVDILTIVFNVEYYHPNNDSIYYVPTGSLEDAAIWGFGGEQYSETVYDFTVTEYTKLIA